MALLTFVALIVVTCAALGTGLKLGQFRALSESKSLPRQLPNGKSEDVVRGSVSEICTSLYEDPDSWARVDEHTIINKHSGLGIVISDGIHGIRITGAISIQDLWAEEQEMLWEAAKFFESNQISKMLEPPPVKIPLGMKKGFFKKGEQIGRNYMFNEQGQIVPVNQEK